MVVILGWVDLALVAHILGHLGRRAREGFIARGYMAFAIPA